MALRTSPRHGSRGSSGRQALLGPRGALHMGLRNCWSCHSVSQHPAGTYSLLSEASGPWWLCTISPLPPLTSCLLLLPVGPQGLRGSASCNVGPSRGLVLAGLGLHDLSRNSGSALDHCSEASLATPAGQALSPPTCGSSPHHFVSQCSFSLFVSLAPSLPLQYKFL